MIELMVVVAIIGITMALAIPNVMQWFADQRLKAAARSVADAFSLARTEAIRTDHVFLVFFQEERPGVPLVDGNGTPIPVEILDDGRQGSAGQNCQIDAGEPVRFIPAEAGVSWGASFAGSNRAPEDPVPDGTPVGGGISLLDPTGASVTWVAFLPSGVPVGATAGCNLGTTGSGSGAIYVSNGVRDFAVVLSPLGAVRVHAFDRNANNWRN
jgi:type II secretory pathway pseudopilin PulG